MPGFGGVWWFCDENVGTQVRLFLNEFIISNCQNNSRLVPFSDDLRRYIMLNRVIVNFNF
jgi:hypothetical protein